MEIKKINRLQNNSQLHSLYFNAGTISQRAVCKISQIKREHNIAIISKCQNEDKLASKNTFNDINNLIAVSEFEFTCALPKNLKSSLPDIKEIEAELGSSKESGDVNE